MSDTRGSAAASSGGTPDGRFDAARVRRYYDRHTSTFVAFGRGGSVGAIHRAVWGPGVSTREDAFHYVDAQIARLVAEHASEMARDLHVVDLGCGVGASLCYLAERLPIRATGITLSPVQVQLATERIRRAGLAERVTCVEASYDDLPPSLVPADVAYAIESFAHAADPLAFFAQCARLVRDGGRLVICDDVRRVECGARATVDRAIDRFRRGWHLNTLLRVEELRALAEVAGFTCESTADLSPYLEPLSVRDRALDTLFGWLPLSATPLGPVLGGAALQRCLAERWTAYELMVFRRATSPGGG